MVSQISKVIEMWLAQKLDNFTEKNKLISGGLYGSIAFIELMEVSTAAIERKQYTVGVFIDFKNALDTIDQCWLLSKLLCLSMYC